MKITSKKEFFRLWEAGVLGNRTQLWRPGQWREAFHGSLDPEGVGFRQLNTAGGGRWERVKHPLIEETHARWMSYNIDFRMDDGVPNHMTTMQGEICRGLRGLEGFVAIAGVTSPEPRGLPPMRLSIKAGMHRNVSGSTLLALVQRYMDPSSQDDLWMLLDLYPDATVEFASFACDVGVFPNRNTIFWEVRDY